ncbi:MAG: aspartate carbamoyltransferase catalytic subunit [Bdellovibrio sp.]|jgi:aspartate carbamoyltransferase catalytic subunit
MPAPKAILDLKSLSREQIQILFSRAQALHQNPEPRTFSGQTAALLFFEASTRTRFSFEAACHRAGLGPLVLDGASGTSLEKGETLEDTVFNVAAMNPSVMIIRSGGDFQLAQIASQLSTPIINAGWGSHGHPTQALLDALTLRQEFSEIERVKVLFVGDIKHSRVVASHFELLEKLGAEIGLSGPEEFLVDRPGTNLFRRLEDGLEWCDAVMALRVQFERHEGKASISKEDYRLQYGLSRQKITHHLRHKGVIMHPGPINYGIEMDQDVLSDSRNRILHQVSNGVVLREALIRSLLEGRL